MEVNTISKEEYFNQYFTFKNGQKSNKTKGEELKGRNPFDPLSYIDLFEKYDIPLIPFEWNKYLQKQIERQRSLIFVFGKYLSLMKLKGYKDFTFNDSKELFQSRINGALYQNYQLFLRRKMIVHQCDLCKEITKNYATYVLPINEYMYAEKKGIKLSKFKKGVTTKTVDLCDKCAQALADFLDPYLND